MWADGRTDRQTDRQAGVTQLNSFAVLQMRQKMGVREVVCENVS